MSFALFNPLNYLRRVSRRSFVRAGLPAFGGKGWRNGPVDEITSMSKRELNHAIDMALGVERLNATMVKPFGWVGPGVTIARKGRIGIDSASKSRESGVARGGAPRLRAQVAWKRRVEQGWSKECPPAVCADGGLRGGAAKGGRRGRL